MTNNKDTVSESTQMASKYEALINQNSQANYIQVQSKWITESLRLQEIL